MGYHQDDFACRRRPENRVLQDVVRQLAEALDVTKGDGGLRICSRMREQGGDVVGINEIVLLLVVPKRTLVPHH